jgi:UPF0716 protein FxsA
MWLLFFFIAIPVIEIALFIQVGGLLGLWPTLAIVVLTAILGTQLVRSQGLSTLAALQSNFSELKDPTESLAHGGMILFAGALLLTPGFFTDAVGFLLLTPAFRLVAFRWIKSRFRMSGFQMGGTHFSQSQDPNPGPVYEADFQDVTPNENSPWTSKPLSKD